jgi:hypothetical protein
MVHFEGLDLSERVDRKNALIKRNLGRGEKTELAGKRFKFELFFPGSIFSPSSAISGCTKRSDVLAAGVQDAVYDA